jgi:hypothetical protein
MVPQNSCGKKPDDDAWPYNFLRIPLGLPVYCN